MDFHPAINTFTGLNGMGKTNILEAIYFLCMGKGYFSNQDKFCIQHNDEFFRIEGVFQFEKEALDIVLKCKAGEKKEIEVAGVALERLSDHVGKIPCVIFAPEDIKLLLETSEARRNFLNTTLVQYDKEYLQAIMLYNKLLKSRNSFLKQAAVMKSYNDLYIESLDEQMAGPAKVVFQKRKDLTALLNNTFQELYAMISGKKEICHLTYQSALDKEDPIMAWKGSLALDKSLGRTTWGIHKDDLVFSMNSRPIKNFGSQGQLKSFILALKIAQYKLLESIKHMKPIIMLDDIFDKLDEMRVNHLLDMLTGSTLGQVFITDTDPNRIPSLLLKMQKSGRQFYIENGQIVKVVDYE